MTTGEEYVLGTHDEEIARLDLQHRVWRSTALDLWKRAGFAAGQTLIDVGCGPGYAARDLADLVTPSGRVIAIDKSRRFLDALETFARERGVTHITTAEIDLDGGALPEITADGAWCRWVLAFVAHPRDLVARVRDRLRPGGVFAIHEYFDYATWRAAPRSAELEEFVAKVMETWRSSGGEPDVGLELPRWLDELGFDVQSVRTIVDAVGPGDPRADWLAAFVASGRERLVDLGALAPARADAIGTAVAAFAREERLVITPGVFEIIAVRR